MEYIRIILGYMGIMEKKMETTITVSLVEASFGGGGVFGFRIRKGEGSLDLGFRV